MSKQLSIGETAKRLGLEVDTVRKMERDGRIRAVRTDGGHRRFTEEEVERVRKSRSKPGRAKSAPPRRRSRASNRPIPNRNPTTGEFVGEDVVFADDSEDFDEELSIDELEEFEMTSRPALPPPPARPAPAPQELLLNPMFFAPRPAPAAPAPAVDTGFIDRFHLQSLKMCGRSAMPFNLPLDWQGKVIADLERFVTLAQFPVDLPFAKAADIVRAHVETVIRPWRDTEEKAKRDRKAKEDSDRRLAALISHGTEYARRETTGWDWSARNDARAEVGKVVTREVEADWTEHEVEDLVDEILDEWDDGEDET